MSDDKLLDALNPYKKFLKDNNITVYRVDADAIARKHNLGMKISMIMEKAIFKLIDGVDEDKATLELEDYVMRKFGVRSKEVAINNIEALRDVSLRKVELDDLEEELSFKVDSIYDALAHRKGNSLKVSDFKGYEDGSFIHTEPEMQNISEFVPEWIKENCIQCSMCSLVCPHGVIRPFLLNEDEYAKAPDYVKDKCKPALGAPNHYYVIVSG